MLNARPRGARRSGQRSLTESGSSGGFPVVGVGASAGGLDVCRRLLSALPANTGMVFVLVQHLDPTHESMMADLLSGHASMIVKQATDGMPIEPEHFYIIPPGHYLSVGNGTLHLSQPQARHRTRLPFDFLLYSLAKEYGARAIGVVLSGTGTDGTLGLKAVKDKGGLIIAQDPDEASFDGMPRSAIGTGAVDLVLPVAGIPDALQRYARRMSLERQDNDSRLPETPPHWLPEIIDLLRANTAHDFRCYKAGTLQRRVERRMAMAAIAPDDTDRYLEILRSDATELASLAKDLLINVTSFFRDRKVFDLMAETIIPDLIRTHSLDHPLRIWIAGCSTGEETYSLAMLILEGIAAAHSSVKLQVFASDVDPDAVAKAREGFYPKTIEADVSPERLARFFSREDGGYRVLPDLRAVVVFTVQDVLSDPPFSRLDLISCRNLLIYLKPEAQAKIIALFHFALREGGILLLGSSETLGSDKSHFAVIAKQERVYRHVGRGRLGALGLATSGGDGLRPLIRAGQGQAPSRQAALGELCRRLVLEHHAPAAVLIDSKHQCLYSLGPIDRYLRVAPGNPNDDLLAMARPGLRAPLRSAIQRASEQGARVVVAGRQMAPNGASTSFDIAAEPVSNDAETLLLVCFIDRPAPEHPPVPTTPGGEVTQVAALEAELAATRAELQGAVGDLETANEEQKAINEEASSINEEYQSTNEELLTSKEELQALNEELAALNGQLQETLERQRTTSDDLQNVLYSTDVATLFLDTGLNIRFFTPATRAVFNIIPGDVGRPLADLSARSTDDTLLADASAVIKSLAAIDREIKAEDGAWYTRRILPYRTQVGDVEGVVITFTNVTERRRAADALAVAKRQAELASASKSRFLAAASHDLRQPLQTLSLLQGLLAKSIQGEMPRKLVARLGDTVGAMAGMLNGLLDINQIEAGTVHAEMVDFRVSDLLDRLEDEFSYLAQAKGLVLRVAPCGLSIHSDQRLLMQMLRNLLSNAVKYTKTGKVLVGCRRRKNVLSIEVWDTGVGIPESELQAVFEEYHQLDNAAHQSSLGLGLGLAIVQRLENLLGYRVSVRSQVGKGSVFAIEVALAGSEAGTVVKRLLPDTDQGSVDGARRSGEVLIVEDDPEVRDLLQTFLKDEGHRTATARDGVAALELIERGAIRPDLILSDYNLPEGLDGVQLAAKLRAVLHRRIPVIILTGDISSNALRNIATEDCVRLTKPVRLPELARTVLDLLPVSPSQPRLQTPTSPEPGVDTANPLIFIVDDDSLVREGLRSVLEDEGWTVEDHASCEAFLESYRPGRNACLLVDAYLPGMGGLELLQRLKEMNQTLPTIMITGSSDVPMAVQAMKAGALDFIEKPIGSNELIACIKRALEHSSDESKVLAWHEAAVHQLARLTTRQRQIMDMVLAGQPSKNIAADLGISQRTVENHRASIMKRTGSKSLPALARLALAAASGGDGRLTPEG